MTPSFDRSRFLIPLNADSDRELTIRAQAGSIEAFETLVTRHQDHVYALSLRMLNSPEDAAEVAQETFLSAYRNIQGFRADAQFSSWVYRIAANHSLMRLRRRKISREVEVGLDEPLFTDEGSLMEWVADWAPNAEAQTINGELRNAIEGAVGQLPDEYREAFVLRDLEGMSYEEIAGLTESTVAAVKSRLHRPRLSLRAAINHNYAHVT